MSISVVLPNLHAGGAQRMMIVLANEFSRRGHRVRLVSFKGEGELGMLIDDDVATIDLGGGGVRALPAFLRFARRTRPDLLLSALPAANAFAGIAKAMVRGRTVSILTERNPESLAVSDLKRPGLELAGQLVCWFAYPRADRLVGVSGGVAARLAARYPRLRGRVETIPNPAFPNEAPNDVGGPPHRWLETNAPPCIVAVGRLVPEKDFATLIRSVQIIRECSELRLLIVGDGPERTRLEALAGHLGLADAVELVGFRHDRLAFMRWADACVMSSRHEGFGNVLVEAMAMKTQVVSTDCPYGPREILDHGRYGRLAPPQQPAALAAEIMHALDDPIDPNSLRERARAFSVEAIADRYLDLFQLCRN